MERNILLTIEYDGTSFNGWQRQPGVRTVQAVLEEAFSRCCGVEIKLNGTSRTDSGVHALGQRASLKGDFGIPTERIMKAVNDYLSGGMNRINGVGDVRIVAVEEREPDFHARFDAKGKTYRYLIYNSPRSDIFRRNYAYWVPMPLDIEAMREGARHIVGTHDFACFQSSGGNIRETTVRTVSDISIFRTDENCRATADDQGGEFEGYDIAIEITGDGFLYNMVRIITGTLVEVGLHKREPESVALAIQSCDRKLAGHTAPPGGLYLKEIYFD